MSDPTFTREAVDPDPRLDEVVSQLIRIRARLTVIVAVLVIPAVLWLLAALVALAV